MTGFVNFIHKKCHLKSHHSDIKYHMTLNIIFSVVTEWTGRVWEINGCSSNFRKTTDHCSWIYGITLNLINKKIEREQHVIGWTWKHTLGFWPIKPKNLPGHWTKGQKPISENFFYDFIYVLFLRLRFYSVTSELDQLLNVFQKNIRTIGDDPKLADDDGEVPKPNRVVGGSIPSHENRLSTWRKK